MGNIKGAKMNKILVDLIKLADILKDGYTVKIVSDRVLSFMKGDGYIISIKTLIEIHNGLPILKCHEDINLNGSIIGYWFDVDNNTGYIEKNIFVYDRKIADELALKYRQKYIYDVKNNESVRMEWM